jgi:type IV secretory pathway component VirB8
MKRTIEHLTKYLKSWKHDEKMLALTSIKQDKQIQTFKTQPIQSLNMVIKVCIYFFFCISVLFVTIIIITYPSIIIVVRPPLHARMFMT